MKEAIRAAIEALETARDALVQATTSETFYRDPRGDNAGPAVDAANSALSLVREAGGGGEDADLAVKFRAQHDFLEWNRQQAEPLVKIAYEYGVFDKAVELYKAAMKEGK